MSVAVIRIKILQDYPTFTFVLEYGSRTFFEPFIKETAALGICSEKDAHRDSEAVDDFRVFYLDYTMVLEDLVAGRQFRGLVGG